MILEFMNAQPVRGMIERVDRRASADGAESPDGGACDEAALVHSEIFSGNDVGADLRILVEIQGAANGRFDDPGAGVEPHDAVQIDGIVARVLERLDENVREVHKRRSFAAIEQKLSLQQALYRNTMVGQLSAIS